MDKQWAASIAWILGMAGSALALPTETPPLRPMPASLTAAPVEASNGLCVLGYGDMGDDEEQTAEAFEHQVQRLLNEGFRPISLQDFYEWRAGLKKLPEKAVLLVFEEATDEFMRTALPVLRANSLPFLVFVDTHRLGSTPGYINNRDLQILVRAGAQIGNCTLGKSSLKHWQVAELKGNDATQALAEAELAAPARLLSGFCGSCDTYSHPSDKSDVSLLKHLVRSGYKAAFSRQPGQVKLDSSSFMLPRYIIKNQADFDKALRIATGLEVVVPPTPQPPAAAAIPDAAQGMEFEDDIVAEEVEDDEPAAAEEASPGAPRPTRLTRRDSGGDWVSSAFDKPLVPREETRVAVLGYHNFSNTKPATEMRMHTAEFCQQMQYIKEAGLTVITMQDFLDWLLGTRCLPERCVLITIDDGWKSVYTDAYPVLKAYGYPFTLFLYTRYIDVQGDSMTTGQIKEMTANGATIGSHSSNHLYPKSWKRFPLESEAYADQVQHEIVDSQKVLADKFGNCTSYCYPGGYNTPPMVDAIETSPMQAAFTVLEAKVDCSEDPLLVHRYMVFGTDHNIFRRAVNFDGEAGIKTSREGIAAAAASAKAFFPKAFEGLKHAEKPEPAGNAAAAKKVAPKAPAPVTPATPAADETCSDTAVD